MITLNDFLYVSKHILAIAMFIGLLLIPIYLAAANGRSKYDNMRVRSGAWIFGWSIIGWIFALFVSSKK